MITIDGLNSGLDTEKIITGLLEIQQKQIDRLATKRQETLNKQAAYQSLEAQLVQFRGAAARLSRIQNNVFEARNVSVSDESSLVASADINAARGIYQLSVQSLAQAHQVASQGFIDSDSEITQGTLTIRQGSGAATQIVVDSSNNTLQGLADSINLAKTGVTASIVQDGSSSGAPSRLMLSSSTTGQANAITVTNNLAVSGSGAVRPDFDFNNPVQEAKDAEVRLGSGSGALTVQSSTNRVSNLISGVVIDLLQADSGKTITVRVDQDTATGVDAVQSFVDSYNSLISFVRDQTRFTPENGDAGPLLGDRSLVQIESRIQNSLQAVVPGINAKASRLSAIGISVGDTGKLSLNTSQLQKSLRGDVEGVVPRDLRRLFALDATSTNPNIQFVLGSTKTRESTTPIQVDITRAAERAAIQGTNAIAGSTVIGSSNNQLTVTVDNARVTVTLADGTYTDAGLAEQLQSVINAHPEINGRSVAVGLKDNGAGGNLLTVTSDSYGGTSQATIHSGSAMASLGFTGVENDQGVDVAGRFLVDGVEETATGRGRLLAGDIGNSNTADLQVRVTLSPGQVVAGSEGDMTISRGIASSIDQLIGVFLDSETGVLKSIDEKFIADAKSMQSSIDRQQDIFSKQQEDLISQFVALEKALGELQSTASFLTQQFASLSSLKSSRK